MVIRFDPLRAGRGSSSATKFDSLTPRCDELAQEKAVARDTMKRFYILYFKKEADPKVQTLGSLFCCYNDIRNAFTIIPSFVGSKSN